MQFEWDEAKAEANFLKHGISFDKAKSVFVDPLFLAFADPDHSIAERRFIIMGSVGGRLLVVAYTERSNTVRLISARVATRREQKFYAEEN